MMSSKVQTIQIGVVAVTVPVPPTTFEIFGTQVFIVMVSRVKREPIMIAQGITLHTKKKKKIEKSFKSIEEKQI